ncbi:MAG: hypothetical protein C0456_06315 [Hyphomonas sp.]|nr:hypothetical protein [Hyphomonas sp.]
MQHDHPLEGYQIALNSGAPSFVKAAAQGIPVFVKLGELPKGKHRVRITAVRKNTADATLTGEINVLVREPAAWIPGSLGGDAFSVSLEPSSCNLEDLFENVATIVAYGPQSRKCTATIVLSLVNGDELLRAQVCEPLDFPISPQVWRKKFTQFASQGDWAWRYLDAASGKLVFTVDELGERTFPLQRKTLPLRWVVVRKDGITSVRLLDDTGADDNVATCISYALETPTLLTPHTRQDARIGIGIAGAGRLFYCTSGDDADRLIVSTGLTGNDLQALGFVPNVSDISAGRTTTVEALATIEAWHGARLAGPLADIRRQKILETVHSALFQQICGPAWNRAEAQFLTQSDARSRDELQSHVVKRGGFAVVLKRDYATLPTDGMEIAEWFGALADRFEICKDRSASEFALRLASAPNRIRTWYKNDLERLLENVTQYADVARGARFLALLCARDSEGHNSRMIPRWQWQ